MKVLDLFAGLEGWSRPFKEHGHEVFTTDWDKKFPVDLHADIRDLSPRDLPWVPDLVLASPPCETFSVASIGTHWDGGHRAYLPKTEAAKMGMEIAYAAKSLIDQLVLKGTKWYAVENPRGVLRKLDIFKPAPVTTWYCLAGDTIVRTRNGVYPISELAGGRHEVLNAAGEWQKVPFEDFGFQDTMAIELVRSGSTKRISATPEHGWFVGGKRLTTADLRPGMVLDEVHRFRVFSEVPDAAVARGFTFGDGSLRSRGREAEAQFCGAKDAAMARYFESEPRPRHDQPGVSRIFGLPAEWKSLPSIDRPHGELLGWLQGYFAADGDVTVRGQISLNSASKESLEFVRTVATELGIGTYGVRTYTRKGYGGWSQIHRVGFRRSTLDPDFFLIPAHRANFEGAPLRGQEPKWQVKSISRGVSQQVYCAIVDGDHAFVLDDDILTSNCHYGENRAKPTDIWTNVPSWVPRPQCHNRRAGHEEGCCCYDHEAAPRGAKTGTQGIGSYADRSVIPYELADSFRQATDALRVIARPNRYRPPLYDRLVTDVEGF